MDDGNNKASTSGSAAVCKFYLEGKCRFGEDCHNIHEGIPRKSPQKKPGKQDKSEPDGELGKKPPMKTAADVISRILWDDQLPTERFTVGYIDRFEGVMERPFTAFSWEDIASVDYDTLAIPKHRIQYFKYGASKVWDKNDRLDVVFGSLGYDVSLTEFMAQCDDVRGNSLDCGVKQVHPQLENTDRVRQFDDRAKPTHFLAFRFSNEEIIERVTELTNHIVAVDERLALAVTSPSRLHLTVCMLHLNSTHEVSDVSRALENLRYHVQPPAEGLEITLDKVGNFGSRVIYLNVASSSSDLTTYVHGVANYLRRSCNSVYVLNDFEFHPHVTVTKMSRLREMRTNLIDPALLVKYLDTYFGAESVDTLYFCPIGESPDRDKFYRVISSVPINL